MAYQDLKKEENCSKISSVYIISIEKKRLVYMHIVIYIVILWLTRPSRKDDSARRIFFYSCIYLLLYYLYPVAMLLPSAI